jgi:hypothetical protein
MANLTRNIDTNYDMANETAIKEVKNLISDGITHLSPDLINKLRYKYSDDNIVDSIMEFFIDRRSKIEKVGKIFIKAFAKKFNNSFYTMSLSKFLKLAIKYKKKYDLSDDEFDEIKRVFEAKIFNSAPSANSSVIYPNTNMSRVLGYPITESTDAIQPTSSDDYSYLQDILKIHQLFKPIHSYVVIQTMTYVDLSPETMNVTFDRNKHDINRYVHPLIAALFLPKIENLEERMLYASLSNIINTKYARERIVTKPDYELFYSMVVDPSDVVCDGFSPLRDLKNRVEIQTQLWNNVYNLRNGRVYDASVLELITFIDKCRTSHVDNPDLIFLSDEGIILRRLFSVFAYRPITVNTMPISGNFSMNPLNLPINVNVITSIPYITFKLPNMLLNGQLPSLTESQNIPRFYYENNEYVPKITTIINVNGPLIFYVPRRSLQLPVSIGRPQLGPFMISALSASSRHYQQVNDIEIAYDAYIELNNTIKYYITSVVLFDVMEDNNIILGHQAFLYQYDKNINNVVERIHVYNPRKAIENSNNVYTPTDLEIATSMVTTLATVYVYAHIAN